MLPRVYSHRSHTFLYSTMVSVMFPLSRLPPVPTTKWTVFCGVDISRYKNVGTHFVYGRRVGLRFNRLLSS